MSSYNKYQQDQTININGINIQSVRGKKAQSKLLNKLSGINIGNNDVFLRNAVGINEYEKVIDPTNSATGYDIISRKAAALALQNQSIATMQFDYAYKRALFREFAGKDEIIDFVQDVCNAAIQYDNKSNKFCELGDLEHEYSKTIKHDLQEAYDNIYNLFGFNEGITAWNILREFIIDGYLAYEIVFDDYGQEIVGFNKLDVLELTYFIVDNKKVWVQNINDPINQRVILDSYMIYLSYSSNVAGAELSYIEPLIRPYNILKLLELTKINYNIIHAMINKVFTMPMTGMNKKQAEQEITQTMSNYYDEVYFNESEGQYYINGEANRLPLSKDYWFPEMEGSSPSVELKSAEGHNLNESEMLNYFYNSLKRASKHPFTRFDRSSGGGAIFGDSSDMNFENNRFAKFISRIQALFKPIVLKPLLNQMYVKHPELIEDPSFKNQLNVVFNGENYAEKWNYLNNLEKMSGIANSIQSNLLANDKPYLHIKWVMKHIMEFTDEDLDENRRYFLEDEDGGDAGSGGGGGGDTGGGGMGDFGGGDDLGGDDMGDDDLGGDDLGGDTGDDLETESDDTGDEEIDL
jgi:hypothetical protein